MFGARVEQLPAIWRRLVDAGFESGHAYGKSLRTVKSCVGTDWCRYGVQDSVGLAVALELRYRGLRSPAQDQVRRVRLRPRVRRGPVARTSAIIATETGWNLYVGGNGGFTPRHAELLASDLDTTTLVRTIDRFLMFYVRTADRLQRTAPWIESLEGGLDHLREVIMEDSLGICAVLDEQMASHVAELRRRVGRACSTTPRSSPASPRSSTRPTPRPDDRVRRPPRPAASRPGMKDGQPTDLAALGLGVACRSPTEPASRWEPRHESGRRSAAELDDAARYRRGASQDPQPEPSPPARPASSSGSGTEWIEICPLDRLQPERGVAALVAGEPVAVFRTHDDRLFALHNVDPFSGASVLSRGIVGDLGGVPVVASPLHKQHFALESGAAIEDEPVVRGDLSCAGGERDGGGRAWLRETQRSGARPRRSGPLERCAGGRDGRPARRRPDRAAAPPGRHHGPRPDDADRPARRRRRRSRWSRAALVDAPPDVVVATTGQGFRGWLEVADEWELGERLRAVLADAEICSPAARRPAARSAGRGCARRGRPTRPSRRPRCWSTCWPPSSPGGGSRCSCTATP